MSVNSVCFVCCDKSKALEIGKRVEKSINLWLKHKGFGRCEIEASDFNYFRFIFNCGDDTEINAKKRILSYFMNCSCDYNDVYNGDKLIFTIGSWGQHMKIISLVCDVIEEFGDVYYNFCDADEEWIKGE